MPVVQVSPAASSATPTAQLNFAQMVGEVLAWNPNLPPQMAKRQIQNSYRRILDHRLWFGLLTKGQITVPNVISGGTVNVTTNSPIVTGTGTAFLPSMIGMQFRIGYSAPTYTIVGVSGQVLTLDLPWGGYNYTAAAYQIFQSIVNFGNRTKRVMAMINQLQGYRIILDMNQQVLNISDAWRSTVGWTFLLASYIPTSGNTTVPAGVPQFELYPAPITQQAFPFLTYTQPPDLMNDIETPIVMVRSDVIVLPAIAYALLWGGKKSDYYDPTTAAAMQKQYETEIIKMADMDNNCAQKDLIWEFSRWPLAPIWGSGQWGQGHDADAWPGY